MGTEFDAILRQRGITKAQLARSLGVSPQFVGQIAAGRRKAKPEFAASMEDVLGLAPGALGELVRSPRACTGANPALSCMAGVELAYLGTAMAALAEARRLVLRQRCHEALALARGKGDTRFFDLAPEHAIVDRVRRFDAECAVFTEEGTVDDGRAYADRLCYFIDPFDRSRPFAKALEQLAGEYQYVADAITSERWPLRGLGAPFASITCIRHSKICFNVMLDYVSGTVYVACKAMLKSGLLRECSDPEQLAARGEDILFDPRDGADFVTFVGHEGSAKREQYERHLRDLGFGEHLSPAADPIPGGPARILYLSKVFSRSVEENDGSETTTEYVPACIMSNGEKICEWCGWLAYAAHSDQLRVHEVYAEKFTSRASILLAPPPNYSLFFVDDHGCTLKLERVTRLDIPVRYRSAIVIAHAGSLEVAVWMRAMKQERCRELRLSAAGR